MSVENSLNLMTCACRSLFFLEFLDAFNSLRGQMHGQQLNVDMLYGT